MLTDENICELQENISAKYGDDVAQTVAVELVRNRDNKNIQSWPGYSWWLAIKAVRKEIKHNQRFPLLEDPTLGEAIDPVDFDEQMDAIRALKAVLATPEGKKLAEHFLGVRHFKSRTHIKRLRDELLTHFK